MPDPAFASDRPPPSWWQLGPGLWLVSILILMMAYLTINLPGNWFSDGASQNYPGAALGIVAGFGQAEGRKLVMTGPDSKNAVIVALVTPQISTQTYGLITLDVAGMPDDADVMLFWRNDLTPNKMFTRSLTVAGGHVQDAMLAGDSNWLGRINVVGLIVRGKLAQPLTINELALKPPSAATMLSERWRDWLHQETWTGISLSRIAGGRTAMDLPPPMLAGLAVALAGGGYWILRRWRRWTFSALTLAAILMSGWMVLDMRWQWNLGADAVDAWRKFAGKDLSAKRLAGIDAELEKVAVDVRPQLKQDGRVFIFAQDAVVAGRLGYLLLPAKTYYDIAQGALPSPERIKTGDLILIHRRAGFPYSPERKEFLWDNRFRIRAEIVFARPGTVLARVL